MTTPRVRPRLLLAVLACLMAGSTAAPASAQADCADADLEFAPGLEPRLDAAMQCLVNNERTSRGLPALTGDPRLTLAAQRHTDDMAARGYFDHEAPPPAPYGTTSRERAASSGYPVSSEGSVVENVAAGNMTARTTALQWMGSFGHCSTILSPRYRDFGAGVAASGDEFEVLWTLVFGSTASGLGSARPSDGCPYSSLKPYRPPTPPSPPTGGDPGGGTGAPGVPTGRVKYSLRRDGPHARLSATNGTKNTVHLRVRLVRGTAKLLRVFKLRPGRSVAVTIRRPKGRGRTTASLDALDGGWVRLAGIVLAGG